METVPLTDTFDHEVTGIQKELDPAFMLVQPDQLRWLEEALDIITPPKARDVIEMHFGIGYEAPLKDDEITHALKINPATVKGYKSQALKQLQKASTPSGLEELKLRKERALATARENRIKAEASSSKTDPHNLTSTTPQSEPEGPDSKKSQSWFDRHENKILGLSLSFPIIALATAAWISSMSKYPAEDATTGEQTPTEQIIPLELEP